MQRARFRKATLILLTLPLAGSCSWLPDESKARAEIEVNRIHELVLKNDAFELASSVFGATNETELQQSQNFVNEVAPYFLADESCPGRSSHLMAKAYLVSHLGRPDQYLAKDYGESKPVRSVEMLCSTSQSDLHATKYIAVFCDRSAKDLCGVSFYKIQK